jgi:hypothetical protein
MQLMKRAPFAALAAALLLGPLPSPAQQESGQLDSNPALFSVLAALNAAGYDADIASQSNSPIRPALRKALAAKNIPVLAELKRFIRDHRQDGDTALLSLYISYALCVDRPPDFKFRYRSNDLPPEVAALEGFSAIMQRFHQEAGIDELYKASQPYFEKAIDAYHGPVSQAVLESNGYLRNPTSGAMGRRFQIYVDLLGPPNQVHTRSYGDDFFVVVTPSLEPMIDDIRHAYLQHLVAPLVLRQGEELTKRQGLLDFAQPAPRRPRPYKQDFILLVEKCFVKAIETRLLTGPGTAARRQQLVDQALAEGFILVPYFAEALPNYEKQEQSMRFYFPELITGIDAKKEDKRLERVQFASTPLVRKAKTAPTPQPEVLTGIPKMLEDAEALYEGKQLAESRKLFLDVVAKTDEKPLQAKAYYGLARIAIRENDPELGERLFQKSLDLSPDPATKAWCLVYLGRLADIAGEAPKASEFYKAALAVDGASSMARQTAEKGIAGSFRRKTQ